MPLMYKDVARVKVDWRQSGENLLERVFRGQVPTCFDRFFRRRGGALLLDSQCASLRPKFREM